MYKMIKFYWNSPEKTGELFDLKVLIWHKKLRPLFRMKLKGACNHD